MVNEESVFFKVCTFSAVGKHARLRVARLPATTDSCKSLKPPAVAVVPYQIAWWRQSRCRWVQNVKLALAGALRWGDSRNHAMILFAARCPARPHSREANPIAAFDD
jgi:hypothetical protein